MGTNDTASLSNRLCSPQDHHLLVHHLRDRPCGEICWCHPYGGKQRCPHVSDPQPIRLVIHEYLEYLSVVFPKHTRSCVCCSALSMIGLILIAFGTGGIKPCISAFGGDQFDEENVSGP